MNKERILDLADIIENDRLPNVKFNMWRMAENDKTSKHPCGTVACIAGYAVCAAYGNKRTKEYSSIWIRDEAIDILGLDEDEAANLFFEFSGDPTRTEAAKVLRNFAETGKVNWSII